MQPPNSIVALPLDGSPARVSIRARRTAAGRLLSVGIHGAALVGAVVLAGVPAPGQPHAPRPSIRFVELAPPSVVAPTVQVTPIAPAVPTADPIRTSLAPAAKALASNAPAIVEAPAPPSPADTTTPQPVHQSDRPEPSAAVAQAAPPQPEPIVGLFQQAARPARAVAPSASVATAGFDRERPTTTAADEPVVQSAGFDRQPPRARPVAAVASSGGIDTPLEIVFKPVPAYPPDARAIGLEGSVVLDVEFSADGSVKVLQVVSGLGHGLDEAAAGAARQIRFKPARRAGSSIDVRTTIQISFRLT